MNYTEHLISKQASVRQALVLLDQLAANAIAFLVDEDGKLLGSLTDGDLRRGFIKGYDLETPLLSFVQPTPKFIRQGQYELAEIIGLRDKNFIVLPVLDDANKIINVINFRLQKSYLPVDALIMAGGRGERLRPLTDKTPKPMLPVGGKPIIEHNVDRLRSYGVDDIWISLRYLGEQIEQHFGNGQQKSIRIRYVYEDAPLGTAGALALIDSWIHDTVLVMNSDLLTNIDFEDFYLFFQTQQADLAVACIPYQVNIPYAVMDTDGHWVTGFKEKPTYTHYSNAGIYLMKRSVLSFIPKGEPYNATDLMAHLIQSGKKVAAYPLVGYWLDIGKQDDYKKAQEDIKHIKF